MRTLLMLSTFSSLAFAHNPTESSHDSVPVPDYYESGASYQPYAPGFQDQAVSQLLGQLRGRWVSSCIRFPESSSSRSYGIEFKEGFWSTLVFNYPNSRDCLGAASPNDGMPRTYPYSTVRAEANGWYYVAGGCSDASYACSGGNAVLVNFNGGAVFVRKVNGNSLWFDPQTSEAVYPNGPY